MDIHFTKMHGTGNDFVVINAIEQKISLTTEQITNIADRHFGVGCDQLLLVEASTLAEADFRYRIFNADGSEVGQCGNGARCFARFVFDNGLTSRKSIPVETASGLIFLQLEDDSQVTVNMGTPNFNPPEIPFVVQGPTEEDPEYYSLKVDGEKYAIGAVSIGNPHAVLLVESIDEAPVEVLGRAIECHAQFPQRVNVGFMEIVDRSHIRLRVYERGSAETLACGSGACAAIAVGIRNRLLDDSVEAQLRGGTVNVRWSGEGQPIYLTGPTETVFEGKIKL